MSLGCGHEGAAAGEVCEHLLANHDDSHVRFFSGQGLHYHLRCLACRKAEAPALHDVCAACWKEIGHTYSWEGSEGRPEILERSTPLAFTHETIDLPALRSDQVLDIRPLTVAGCWIALDRAGRMWHLDVLWQRVTPLAPHWPEEMSLEQAVELHVSPDGRFVAVTHPLGTLGAVFDLASDGAEQPTMHLAREDYHAGVSPFGLAFFAHKGRTLMIHATDWNRVDISDPATGELLTARVSPTYEEAHHLDYFHDRPCVSPDAQWVVEEGWVWHPVGIPRVWALQTWLAGSTWESEDGDSRRDLGYRSDFWGGPMCWTDTHTLAIWGYGQDNGCLIPAATLYDVRDGTVLRWFPGPEVAETEGTVWTDRLARPLGALVFDHYLFAISPRFGTSVWDIADGACLHRDPALKPWRHHATDHAFLSTQPDGSFRLSRLH